MVHEIPPIYIFLDNYKIRGYKIQHFSEWKHRNIKYSMMEGNIIVYFMNRGINVLMRV